MNARLAYRSDPRLSIKSINDGVPRVPKCQKRALGRRKGPGTRRGPDLTSHDESPRTSKPSSPSGESDSRVLRGYCGAKGSGNLGPFHIKSKAHAEEEEMSEEPNSRVLRGYCGANESGNPGPFHINPKAHAEEEEMSEDEQRKSELLGDVAEDNPVLGRPRSRKEKASRHQGQSPRAS